MIVIYIFGRQENDERSLASLSRAYLNECFWNDARRKMRFYIYNYKVWVIAAIAVSLQL